MDDREPKKIREFLSEICCVPIEVKRVKTGDYICTSNGVTMVIERKTLSDLAGSIVDGRIFSQVERMQEYLPAAVVICGSKKELLKRSEINYNSVLGTIAWISSLGITVVKEEDPEDLTYLILKLFEKKLKVKMFIEFTPKKSKKKVNPKTLNTPVELTVIVEK